MAPCLAPLPQQTLHALEWLPASLSQPASYGRKGGTLEVTGIVKGSIQVKDSPLNRSEFREQRFRLGPEPRTFGFPVQACDSWVNSFQ